MSQGAAGYNQGPGANTKFATLVDEVSGQTLHFQEIVPYNPGEWDYRSGVSGIPDFPSTARILSLAAVAGESDGSVVIDGGSSIPIPAGMSFGMTIEADLIDPAIVFTGTVSYVVQYVSGV